MKTVAVALAAALLMPARADGADAHWLVGRWDGTLAEFTGRSGPARTFRVAKVNADGSAQATWYISGTPSAPATVQVTGSRVRVVTVAKSLVELERHGDGLVGTFTLANGRSFAIQMARSTAPEERADGEWSLSYGDGMRFYLSLRQQNEKVTGTYSNPGYGGATRVDGDPIAGTFTDGVLRIGVPGIIATVTGDRMQGRLRAGSSTTQTADFIGVRGK